MADQLRNYVPQCRGALLELNEFQEGREKVNMMLTTLDVMEAELQCEKCDWERLKVLIQVRDVPALSPGAVR